MRSCIGGTVKFCRGSSVAPSVLSEGLSDSTAGASSSSSCRINGATTLLRSDEECLVRSMRVADWSVLLDISESERDGLRFDPTAVIGGDEGGGPREVDG